MTLQCGNASARFWTFVALGKCPHSAESSDFQQFPMARVGDVARGLQPGQISLDNPMPGVARQGWQRCAAQHVEERLRTDIVWPRFGGRRCCALRVGPWQVFIFFCISISMATRFEPQEFRILRLRRFWCLLPLCSASCRCGRPLFLRGHRRAACQVAGVLGRRGFLIETAVARVCRKASGRVTTNVRVQNLDIPPGAAVDNRRLAVDATMRHNKRCRHDTGQEAQRTNVPGTCPSSWTCRGGEVGGRWSGEALSFVHSLSKAKARSEPEEFRKVVERAWVRR